MYSFQKEKKVPGIEKSFLNIDVYTSNHNFTLLVILPRINTQQEKLFITILGENLTINYEFHSNGFHSQTRIISLPPDLDKNSISTEFEERVLRLTFSRTNQNLQKHDSLIFLTFPAEEKNQKREIDLPETRIEKPIEFIHNPFMGQKKSAGLAYALFSPSCCQEVMEFHRTLPNFKITPLISLPNLAKILGIRSLWVKDESKRLGLNSFKVLGGSYAIAKTIQSLLNTQN